MNIIQLTFEYAIYPPSKMHSPQKIRSANSVPSQAPQGKCLLILARRRFGFRTVPCGFLGHMVVLDQSGIHLADEVLYGNGCHFGTAQLDRPQQLDADAEVPRPFSLWIVSVPPTMAARRARTLSMLM